VGPWGLAFIATRYFAFVSCTDHVQVLDAAHDGVLLGRLDVGAGVDNIDYVDGRLYVAAGKGSTLRVASIASTSSRPSTSCAGPNGGCELALARAHVRE